MRKYIEKDLDEIYQDCISYAKNCESWDYATRDVYLKEIGQYQITEPDELFDFIINTDVFHDACGKVLDCEYENGKLISVTITTDY